MQTELGVDQVPAMQSDLDSVSWAAQLLPMRRTDLFFSLRGRIQRVRARIASRLVEAQGRPPGQGCLRAIANTPDGQSAKLTWTFLITFAYYFISDFVNAVHCSEVSATISVPSLVRMAETSVL